MLYFTTLHPVSLHPIVLSEAIFALRWISPYPLVIILVPFFNAVSNNSITRFTVSCHFFWLGHFTMQEDPILCFNLQGLAMSPCTPPCCSIALHRNVHFSVGGGTQHSLCEASKGPCSIEHMIWSTIDVTPGSLQSCLTVLPSPILPNGPNTTRVAPLFQSSPVLY